jgi:hypothetical protein
MPGVEAPENTPTSVLTIELSPGLGGAWTEIRRGREVIRFGYPRDSRLRWFQVLAAPGIRHHVLSLAIERIVFARQITAVEYGSEELLPMLRGALRNHSGVALRAIPIHPEVVPLAVHP